MPMYLPALCNESSSGFIFVFVSTCGVHLDITVFMIIDAGVVRKTMAVIVIIPSSVPNQSKFIGILKFELK